MSECEYLIENLPGCHPQEKPWEIFLERGWISEDQYRYILNCEAAGFDVNVIEPPVRITPASMRHLPHIKTKITVSMDLDYFHTKKGAKKHRNMDASKARELTKESQKGELSLFDCLIAIRQAAKNGANNVEVKQNISAEVQSKLQNEGYKISKVNNNLVINW